MLHRSLLFGTSVAFSLLLSVPGDTTAEGRDEDLSEEDLKQLRELLKSDDPVEAYYLRALDAFSKADRPKSVPTAFYAGSSLLVDATGSERKVQEEASFLILQEERGDYDQIIPETDEERQQVNQYLSHFHLDRLPPADDPLRLFCQNLDTGNLKDGRMRGKSLLLDRPLKNVKETNSLYLRESEDSLLVVELGPPKMGKRFFFVGVFSKRLKTIPSSK